MNADGSYRDVTFHFGVGRESTAHPRLHSGNPSRKQVARSYKEAGVALPPLGEKVFLTLPRLGRISIFVYGAYGAFVLIAASSQRRAYLIANAFRAATTCFQGSPPTSNYYDAYLLELASAPTPNMSRGDVARSIEQRYSGEIDTDILEVAMCSGTGLDHVDIARACDVVREAIRTPVILDALLHQEYSQTLVWGFMVGSFYESHYSRDRRQFSRYELERTYLENRFRYDSAFVSAFRGIECILGKPYFNKTHIPGLLSEADRRYGTTFTSQRYRSWHEVFSTKKKWWNYADLIAYYLKLRNSVSAHGNPSPPHIVMQDQVFEIQYLLQTMIGDILFRKDRGKGPEQED
jgi:hypothetical protein